MGVLLASAKVYRGTRGGAMPDRLDVLLVDDDPFTRMTLVTTLKSLDCWVVADAATAVEGLRLAAQTRPDVAVLDLDLGEGPTGIDLAHRLRAMLPAIGIVMLSTYEEPRLMGFNQQPLPEDALYLVKRTVVDPEVLGRALRMSVDPGLGDGTMRVVSQGNPRVKLSDNQIDIMRLVAAGHSNAEIARRRSLTVPAVEKAVARLIRQLDLQAAPDTNQRVAIAQAYYRLTGAVSARR
jgi:DNA-binding NarL/FixJ family response regulator